MRSPRVTLEPVGPFAFLVAFGHVALGAGLWWWLNQPLPPIQASPGANLLWMAPEDFLHKPAGAVSTATPTKVESAPVAKSEPLVLPPVAPARIQLNRPAPPPTPKPAAAPTVVEAPAPALSPPAPALAPKPPEPEAEVPKAVAITPEQAAAMMAAAPAAQPPPPPPTPKEEPTPAAKPEPPPAPKVKPPSTVITLTHHDQPAEPVAEKPKAASLLDIAALDAQNSSTGGGAPGANKGVAMDEVDRAIIDGFKKNWVPPDASKLTVDQRSVQMHVALNRVGRVISFKLLRPSGSTEMDSSVQKAADLLDKIDRALPPGYAGERYEVQINFHVE